MIHYRYALLASILLLSNAHAFQPKVEIVEQFDNLRLVAFISMEDITSSPEWNPNIDAPPLRVDEAIQAVKEFYAGSEGLAPIKEIEIRPVPRYETHWHYLIKIANPAKQTRYDIYVVLMSGRVIPAIIEPEGYK